MLAFPEIDPIAFQIGPMAIRWYALAYIAGLLLGWQYAAHWARKNTWRPNAEDFENFLTWAIFGVVLGGRIGYCLFYQPEYYLSHPAEILMVWHGGMSFHGGALGVIAAIIAFARFNKIHWMALGDLVAAATPIGLFFGRIANFINGELYGRVTDSSLGMVFPNGGELPRHPSQLYQAAMEGLILFAVLFFVLRNDKLRARHGFTGGAFLAGYGCARIIGELFREPDAFLGFIGIFTMGQLLSLPMIAVGVFLMLRARPADVR
ncbi:MAG TPA: prolipoprotein diacylglyceryl transferase [Alphaproteobacteria bacterium]|nr:prolipoprotein diacylglyceryl transferase [Rhodospirillaceae bacterium]HRJ12227.1 prolipoprotein diacylglyceryl transferase [Alphaproteobacteria bacterium]